MMFIENNGFGLRAIELEDLDWLKNLRNNSTTWKNLETVVPLSMNLQNNWFKKLNETSSSEYFVFTNENDENIGLVRITDIDYVNRKACIGLDINIEYRGKKLAVIGYNLIFDYLFNYKNMNRLFLFVIETNIIAINLYNKIGFVEEGRQREAIIRNDRKIDYIMMSILASEFRRLNSDE
ncbi:GNAT family N-acetyltransferase [Vibrio coralliilyticus]|uniref:GNAT family N-acetyltransferase n=1 Tax=Vibrio coralliilyticus TaxID=190893 RepID=UPI00148C7F55|nr:GNAT family protein [Vibrio coralliilyticus]NOH55541.1 GNAT family N-acetyltransferase [Vibrio coralliilyticus]